MLPALDVFLQRLRDYVLVCTLAANAQRLDEQFILSKAANGSSGIQREDAHRFYKNNGFQISGYHFRCSIESHVPKALHLGEHCEVGLKVK